MDIDKQLADMDYFSPDPDFKVYHNAEVHQSYQPQTWSWQPFFIILIEIYDVIMLPSPLHLREMFLMYANMNNEGNEKLF